MNFDTAMDSIYHVVCSQDVIKQVRQLSAIAQQLELAEDFVGALNSIAKKLGTEPLIFGEPRYHLRSLDIEMRIGVILPLAVSFAVHAPSNRVFVRWFKLMPGEVPPLE